MPYLSFFVLAVHTVAFQYSVLAVEEQFTEPLDSVALPVLHHGLQIFNSLKAIFTINGCVGSLQDSSSGGYALVDVVLSLIVEVALVAQFLSYCKTVP